MNEKAAVRVVLCTCPSDAAATVARILLEERLVACVNIVTGVRSLYWWNGSIEDAEESLLVIKTPVAKYDDLERRLNQIHPYDVPEILSLGVDNGSEAYISWVYDQTLA